MIRKKVVDQFSDLAKDGIKRSLAVVGEFSHYPIEKRKTTNFEY